jgi:glycosyltransferase involved in cell wall biosynthesis
LKLNVTIRAIFLLFGPRHGALLITKCYKRFTEVIMQPKIAILSTYPPTQCGIATFSQSLVNGLLLQDARVDVVRLIDEPQLRPSKAVVHQHLAGQDLAVTTAVLNNYDVVMVQHEFGIFGGTDGDEVLLLMSKIRVPVIVVLHTVLTSPTAHQRFILQRIIELADALVTMTNTGKENLLEHYNVDPSLVHVIPHGSADLRSAHTKQVASGQPTILTWGLLSEGKGIEWGIDALAMLGDLTPKPRYVVAGQTHPKVKVREGEKYRNFLKERAVSNGVANDVQFVDKYMESEELKSLIQSADVILLPYDSRDQVTSGVLVEAMVAGKPIISTRFPHATELLADGSGALVDQFDPRGIAEALRLLLTDKFQANRMQSRSEKKADSFLWPAVSKDYLALVSSLSDNFLMDVPSFVVS